MVEEAEAASTRRRRQALPADHPAADLAVASGDCIAEVPAEMKAAVAGLHGDREPPDTPLDPGKLV
jgi:hypothetical protein